MPQQQGQENHIIRNNTRHIVWTGLGKRFPLQLEGESLQ